MDIVLHKEDIIQYFFAQFLIDYLMFFVSSSQTASNLTRQKPFITCKMMFCSVIIAISSLSAIDYYLQRWNIFSKFVDLSDMSYMFSKVFYEIP